MEIQIRITADELKAIKAYAEFCYKWPHGGDPCFSGCSGRNYPDNCYGYTKKENWQKDKSELYDHWGTVLDATLTENTYVRDYIKAYHERLKAKSDAEAAQNRYIWADGHCRELEDKFTIVGEVTVTQNPPVVEPSVLADGSLNPDGEYGRMR